MLYVKGMGDDEFRRRTKYPSPGKNAGDPHLLIVKSDHQELEEILAAQNPARTGYAAAISRRNLYLVKWEVLAMPSKTSSIKKQIILHDVRQVGWLSVLYFLALLFNSPIQIIIQYSTPQGKEYMEKGNLFLYIPEVQWLLLYYGASASGDIIVRATCS